MRNKGIFASGSTKAKRGSPQKGTEHTPRGVDKPRQVLKPQEPNSCTSGHTSEQTKGDHLPPLPATPLQIYLNFCRFWSPIFSTKHQSTPNKF